MDFQTRFASVLLIGVTAISLSLSLSACSSSGSVDEGKASKFDVAKDQELARLVPASVAKDGKLVVATSPEYAPIDFKDPAGKIVGFDPDLFDAVASRLGLRTEWVGANFATIIPGITGGKYEVGVAAFTDNAEREKVVDMITYFNAGTQWAAAAGGDPVDPDNACGLKIAVQTGTLQDTETLPALDKACRDADKDAIVIQKYQKQGDATTAVILGKADAMLADSPVTSDAVAKSDGKLAIAGDIYDAAPYGYAVSKDQKGLTEAIQRAVQSLIDDGTYDDILSEWGLTSGGIQKSIINGAEN